MISSKNVPYTGLDNLDVMKIAKRYNKFLANEILKYDTGANKILDFGAGIGTFSSAFNNQNLILVEPDKALRNSLEKDGYQAYPDLSKIDNDSLDFIYSLNVLEHIKDDIDSLKELSSKLKTGGQILLYVPAFQSLYSSMDRKLHHYRRYKKKDIIKVMEDVSFEIEEAVYVDSLGYLATLIYKIVGSREGNLNPTLLKIYDRFFFPISRALDKIGFNRFIGKNLLILAYRIK